MPASRPGRGQEPHQPYAQAVASPVCERRVSGISMVGISIISNTRTEGISVLASIVELSVGDQSGY